MFLMFLVSIHMAAFLSTVVFWGAGGLTINYAELYIKCTSCKL